MKTVTVLTTTYNRQNLLADLYNSLKSQTNLDFEWLIIDDGSTDDTESIVEEFKNNEIFEIRYERKKNGGKHTALNYAYSFISSPLTFIVDSDDKVTPDAIDTIVKTYNKFKNEDDLCGFSFLRGTPDGGYLSDSGVKYDGLKATYVECRVNGSIGGDMAEVWYTRCLKEFPFPEFEGEKFLGEDVVWVRMSKKYKMRFFNNVIYISDYLDDGLTKNRRRHNIQSPKGCICRAETFLDSDSNLKTKIKSMLQYFIYGKFSNIKFSTLLFKSTHKLLSLICLFPSIIIYLKWKSQYTKNQ